LLLLIDEGDRIMSSVPSALETAAIRAVLQEAEPEMAVLKTNLSELKVSRREITDYGFQTWFDSRNQPAHPIKRKLINNDVFAEIEGMSQGAGFIIHLDNGKIKSLECVCYGDNNHPTNFNGKFAFYSSSRRHAETMNV